MTLRDVVARLRRHHGAVAGPPTHDPFELLLFEHVACLEAPDRRRIAFERLREEIGTSATAILSASASALGRVTSLRILEGTSAEKLRACARLRRDLGRDFESALGGPVDDARRMLQRFPGVGEPCADRILLFSGAAASLAPESNGLRVLARLGLVAGGQSRARTYRDAQALGHELTPTAAAHRAAHLVLQRHGQAVCRRAAPTCPTCPLRRTCPSADVG